MWKSFRQGLKEVEKLPLHFHKMQIICGIAGLALYAAARAAGSVSPAEEGKLQRPSHGQGEKEYVLYVKGMGEEEIPIKAAIGEKKYGDEEAEKVFQEAWKNLLLAMPGENTSLSQVRTNLSFPGWLDEYGLRVRWFSDNTDIVDNYGKIQRESQDKLSESGEEVWIRAVLSDGEREKEYQTVLQVKPVILTEEERIKKGLEEEINAADELQREEDWVSLPKEYQGQALEYIERKEDYSAFFPAAGFTMAILYGFKERQEKSQKEKKRNRQLLLDYSEIISRLMVFIGAGMTVRGAWGKVVGDYEKRLEGKVERHRYAYEEMRKTYYQIGAGKAEGEAYEEFGRRCGLQPYMKLAGILIQNRKEGKKDLNQVMKTEMDWAFEERKNLARRQGEEAGTKLLAPLFLMLGVVMVMIMAPAMMAFY